MRAAEDLSIDWLSQTGERGGELKEIKKLFGEFEAFFTKPGQKATVTVMKATIPLKPQARPKNHYPYRLLPRFSTICDTSGIHFSDLIDYFCL